MRGGNLLAVEESGFFLARSFKKTRFPGKPFKSITGVLLAERRLAVEGVQRDLLQQNAEGA